MIDPERIAYWIALWYERVGRSPSAPVFQEYQRALASLSTAEFDRVAQRLYASESFLPPPARFLALAGERSQVSAADVISKISSLSVWMPNGHAHPSIPLVRDKLGAAAAEAYGFVGPSRLFSENQTTRDIAERDFAATFSQTVQDDPRTALPRPSDRMLDGPIHPDLVKRLKAESTA